MAANQRPKTAAADSKQNGTAKQRRIGGESAAKTAVPLLLLCRRASLDRIEFDLVLAFCSFLMKAEYGKAG
jgi:hypothetical protein